MNDITKEERRIRFQASTELSKIVFTEKNFSWFTIEKITQFLRPTAKVGGDQHHRQVLKVLDIVKTSKTEEEINGKLEKIME